MQTQKTKNTDEFDIKIISDSVMSFDSSFKNSFCMNQAYRCWKNFVDFCASRGMTGSEVDNTISARLIICQNLTPEETKRYKKSCPDEDFAHFNRLEILNFQTKQAILISWNYVKNETNVTLCEGYEVRGNDPFITTIGTLRGGVFTDDYMLNSCVYYSWYIYIVKDKPILDLQQAILSLH